MKLRTSISACQSPGLNPLQGFRLLETAFSSDDSDFWIVGIIVSLPEPGRTQLGHRQLFVNAKSIRLNHHTIKYKLTFWYLITFSNTT